MHSISCNDCSFICWRLTQIESISMFGLLIHNPVTSYIMISRSATDQDIKRINITTCLIFVQHVPVNDILQMLTKPKHQNSRLFAYPLISVSNDMLHDMQWHEALHLWRHFPRLLSRHAWFLNRAGLKDCVHHLSLPGDEIFKVISDIQCWIRELEEPLDSWSTILNALAWCRMTSSNLEVIHSNMDSKRFHLLLYKQWVWEPLKAEAGNLGDTFQWLLLVWSAHICMSCVSCLNILSFSLETTSAILSLGLWKQDPEGWQKRDMDWDRFRDLTCLTSGLGRDRQLLSSSGIERSWCFRCLPSTCWWCCGHARLVEYMSFQDSLWSVPLLDAASSWFCHMCESLRGQGQGISSWQAGRKFRFMSLRAGPNRKVWELIPILCRPSHACMSGSWARSAKRQNSCQRAPSVPDARSGTISITDF